MELKIYLHSVKLIESSFGKTPEVLNAIDVYSVTFGKFILTMIDSIVSIESYVNKSMVPPPSIGIQNSIFKVQFPLYDLMQSNSLTVWNDLCVDLYPPILILPLNETKDWLFECASSSLQLTMESTHSLCSEVALIYFNLSTNLLSECLDPVYVDELSKEKEIVIDGFTIESQK